MNRHRLAWLLSSGALANLGDGIGKVAFPLLAATLTRDPLQIAALSAAQFVPWLLFGALAGVLLDRFDRRRAMVAANAMRALVIGLLSVAVLFDAASLPMIYVAALLAGIAETVADSAANVLIPAVVDRDDLESANSKLQSIELVGQTFIGSPVGGLAFAAFAALPFLLTSVGFAGAAVVLIPLAGSYLARTAEPDAERESVRTQLAGGVRWLRGNPVLFRLALVVAALGLTMEFAQAQLVLYGLEQLSLPEAAFGVFALSAGVGGLGGAAVAPRLTIRWTRSTVLVAGIVVSGVALVVAGFVRQPFVAGLLLALFGAAVVAVNVVVATLRHRLVPDELLGRVLGVWRTLVWGSIAVGALVGGVVTKLLGTVGRTFTTAGILVIAIGLAATIALRGLRTAMDRTDDSPDDSPDDGSDDGTGETTDDGTRDRADDSGGAGISVGTEDGAGDSGVQATTR